MDPETQTAKVETSIPQKPSLGRSVIYSHPGVKGGGTPYACAAVITSVAQDGSVSLFTFPPNMSPEQFPNVKQGDAAGQWNWPPRV